MFFITHTNKVKTSLKNKLVTCNYVPEELNGIRELLRAFALPLRRERWNGAVLEVHSDGRERDELALNYQASLPCEN